MLKRGCAGELDSYAKYLDLMQRRGATIRIQHRGAEHNMELCSDDRNTLFGLANFVVDHAAGCSARSGKDEELRFFAPFGRPPPRMLTPLFLTAGGITVFDPPAEHIRRYGAQRALAVATSSVNCASSRVFTMAWHGDVDVELTISARATFGERALGAAIRSGLGRLRASMRELSRASRFGVEAGAIKRVLEMGDADACPFCYTGAKEDWAHHRSVCEGSRDALAMGELRMSEAIGFSAASFWFAPERRVGHRRAGMSCSLRQAGARIKDTHSDGRVTLLTMSNAPAAVMTRERVLCLADYWTGSRWQPLDFGAAVAAFAARGVCSAGTTTANEAAVAPISDHEAAELLRRSTPPERRHVLAARRLGFRPGSTPEPLEVVEACTREVQLLPNQDHAPVPLRMTAHGVLQTAVELLADAAARRRSVPQLAKYGTDSMLGPPPLHCIRQLPPALRAWIRRHLFAPSTLVAEALQSPLSFTSGIFELPPCMHPDALSREASAAWSFSRESPAPDGAAWGSVPWDHDVFVCAEETVKGELEGLFQKAVETARRGGGRVVLAVTRVEADMQMFDNQLPVQPVFRFPPGTVMWGDAAGWPSWKKGGRATNESSWSMLDGIVVAGTAASAASLPRRTACGNTAPSPGSAQAGRCDAGPRGPQARGRGQGAWVAVTKLCSLR